MRAPNVTNLVSFIYVLLQMRMREKVAAVNLLFESLDQQIASFQTTTTIHCKTGCGKCCFKPDIEATVLEFLPFAYHLYTNKLADEWLDKISASDSTLCVILSPTQSGAGLCSEYPHRGLICRLFGYSARTNKYGKKEFVTCQIIKTEQKEMHANAVVMIEEETVSVPVMNQYYLQLQSIDYDLTRNFYPINEAIRRAIELVQQDYYYQDLSSL